MERYELVPYQESDPSGRSNDDKTLRGWPQNPTKLRRWHASTFMTDILCIATAIPFYVLIIICARSHGKVVVDSNLKRMQDGLDVVRLSFRTAVEETRYLTFMSSLQRYSR